MKRLRPPRCNAATGASVAHVPEPRPGPVTQVAEPRCQASTGAAQHVSCKFRNFFATLVFWSGCRRGKTPANRHNALVAQWIEHRFPKSAPRVLFGVRLESIRVHLSTGRPPAGFEPAVPCRTSNFLATCRDRPRALGRRPWRRQPADSLFAQRPCVRCARCGRAAPRRRPPPAARYPRH